MSDLTAHKTQDTSPGTSATLSQKTKLRKKQETVKEVEVEFHPDGKITSADGEEYVINTKEDFSLAILEARSAGIKGIEISNFLFDSLFNDREARYMIYGTPPVYIYRQGTMDKQQKIDALSVERLGELKAKKAREELAKKKEAEMEIDSL